MLTGAHAIIYSTNADADRAFLARLPGSMFRKLEDWTRFYFIIDGKMTYVKAKVGSVDATQLDHPVRMRPGDPPTLDTATKFFQNLFFNAERYDLSAVGRVKMNMRLDLDAPDTVRTLRREDILAVVKALVDLRDGRLQGAAVLIP